MALTKITSDVIGTGAITSDKLASGAVSASSLSSITTDNVSEGSTNTYFTNARARSSVSVTGGNLSYDSGTGVIQLTTDQIRTAVTGGTGVSISAGEISIGQDVSTSSTPTFGNITTTGYIAGPATFTIDPAAVGDNTGTVVIAGNLQVDGTTTTINSTTMEVDDLNITLASGAANAAAADGAGITVDGASATITYNGTLDTWEFNKELRLTTGSFASHVNGNRYIKYRSTYDSAIVADFELKSDNNSAAVARITSTGTADVLQVFDNTTQVVTIADGGNVGIQKTDPYYNLHVEEAIAAYTSNAAGSYTIDSNTIILTKYAAGNADANQNENTDDIYFTEDDFGFPNSAYGVNVVGYFYASNRLSGVSGGSSGHIWRVAGSLDSGQQVAMSMVNVVDNAQAFGGGTALKILGSFNSTIGRFEFGVTWEYGNGGYGTVTFIGQATEAMG